MDTAVPVRPVLVLQEGVTFVNGLSCSRKIFLRRTLVGYEREAEKPNRLVRNDKVP